MLETAQRLTGIPTPLMKPSPTLMRAMADVTAVFEKVIPLPPSYRAESLRNVAGLTPIGSDEKARNELGFRTALIGGWSPIYSGSRDGRVGHQTPSWAVLWLSRLYPVLNSLHRADINLPCFRSQMEQTITHQGVHICETQTLSRCYRHKLYKENDMSKTFQLEEIEYCHNEP